MFNPYILTMSLRLLPPTRRRNRHRPHHEEQEQLALCKALFTFLALLTLIYVILALASYVWRHPDVNFTTIPWRDVLTFEQAH